LVEGATWFAETSIGEENEAGRWLNGVSGSVGGTRHGRQMWARSTCRVLIGPGGRKRLAMGEAACAGPECDQLHHFIARGSGMAAPGGNRRELAYPKQIGRSRGDDGVLVIDDHCDTQKGTIFGGLLFAAPNIASALRQDRQLPDLGFADACAPARKYRSCWGCDCFFPSSWTSNQSSAGRLEGERVFQAEYLQRRGRKAELAWQGGSRSCPIGGPGVVLSGLRAWRMAGYGLGCAVPGQGGSRSQNDLGRSVIPPASSQGFFTLPIVRMIWPGC